MVSPLAMEELGNTGVVAGAEAGAASDSRGKSQIMGQMSMGTIDKPVSTSIYGPVSSWRLGRSLGIDLLSTEGSTCSFDCIYCQLGPTVHPQIERREFVSLSQLTQELNRLDCLEADYATFSGVGEPTLASNLGEAIPLVRSTLGLPIAILTNSSLITREDVQEELSLADFVIAKLDAPSKDLFLRINRPYVQTSFEEIVEGLKVFRKGYHKILALQMMFVEANRYWAWEMAQIAEGICPDEIQINTPLRPSAVKPLSRKELDSVKRAFSHLGGAITVYDSERPDVSPLDTKETLRRRKRL